MNNYQLYSTNVLLSGQLKWDLILESTYNGLYVNKFNISPISNNIAFEYEINDDILNYSHQENIRTFYKKTEGTFFGKYLEDNFKSNYPLISGDKSLIQYSDMYLMGAKRSTPFTKYNKEIEFLCPIWIENLNEPLSFTININSIINDVKNNIASKTLVINKRNENYHNKFVNYFNNYIKYLGLDKGDDKLINFNLVQNSCNISGISLESGNLEIKNNDIIINNILDRERPLMEIDNIIINLFQNHKLITKQLFNFNLCFNIEDILSTSLFNLLTGNKLNIEIIAKIGDEELILKDFYTNYEFIPRQSLDNQNDNINKYKKDINVFNYLNDNKYIDIIDKNKFSPCICHWSLISNNDYIFNMYSGFGSYYEEDGKVNVINQRYLNSPDLKYNKYYKTLHNIGWCNHDMNLSMDTYKSFLRDRREFIKKSSTFNYDKWTNYIYYSDTNKENISDLNVYVCKCSLENYTKILNTRSTKYMDDNGELVAPIESGVQVLNDNTLFISPWDDCLLFITNDADSITFKGILTLLNGLKLENSIFGDGKYTKYLTILKSILSNVKYPQCIKINKTIVPYVTDGPSSSCKEIEYYKKDDANVYLYRYDGYIKPTFIDKDNKIFFNYLYEKKFFNKNKINQDILRLNFEFIYPSIQYCFYKTNSLNYEKYNTKLIEYKWYNNGSLFCLDSIINMEIDMNFDEDINKYIELFFKNKYPNLKKYELKYIMSLYDIEMDYKHKYEDYSDLKDLKEQIKKIHCNIKLILK